MEKEKRVMNNSIFKGATLMITGGTGSFGNAVLERFLKTDIKEIRIFSRDEKKQDDMRHLYNNDKLYNALIVTHDFSLPYSSTAYSNFILNNKNFYMQRFMTTFGNVIDGSFTKTGLVKSLFDTFVDAQQLYYTVDNILNKPDNIKELNCEIILHIFYNYLTIYCYDFIPIDSDIRTFNSVLYRYGYTYSEMDNIKNVDNIRKYFNYIKTKCETVKRNNGLANDLRREVIRIFERGITLWNYIPTELNKLFDYTVNNYEVFLDE